MSSRSLEPKTMSFELRLSMDKAASMIKLMLYKMELKFSLEPQEESRILSPDKNSILVT